MSDDSPNVLRTPIDQPLLPLDDEERHAVVALLAALGREASDGRLPVSFRPLPQLLERMIEESAAAYRAARSDAPVATEAPGASAMLQQVADRLGVATTGDVLDVLDATIKRAAEADDGPTDCDEVTGMLDAYAAIQKLLSASAGRCLRPDGVVAEVTRLAALNRRLGTLEQQVDDLSQSEITQFRRELLGETADRLVRRVFPAGDD